MSLSFLPRIFPRSDEERQSDFERSLIRREAEIGGQLFGKLPKGHDRKFFCLDEHTWVWHEEWLDKKGVQKVASTRYYVRPTGIIKSQDGQAYKKLSVKETHNLCRAAELYLSRIESNYRHLFQSA